MRKISLNEFNKKDILDVIKKGASVKELYTRLKIPKTRLYKYLDKYSLRKTKEYMALLERARYITSKYKENIVHNSIYECFPHLEKDTCEYILGYWFGDGTVSKTSYGMTVVSTDRHIIYDIKKALKEDNKVNKKVPKHNKHDRHMGHKPLYTITMHNKYIRNYFIQVGCGPNKSHISYSIDKNIITPAFLRGFYDSDGGITLNKNRNSVKMYFTGTNKGLLLHIKEYFRNFGVESFLKENTYGEKRKTRIYSLDIRDRNDIARILNFLYKDSTIHLNRKYKKYKEELSNFKGVFWENDRLNTNTNNIIDQIKEKGYPYNRLQHSLCTTKEPRGTKIRFHGEYDQGYGIVLSTGNMYLFTKKDKQSSGGFFTLDITTKPIFNIL